MLSIFGLLFFANLKSAKWYLTTVLNHLCLNISKMELVFICLRVIYISFFMTGEFFLVSPFSCSPSTFQGPGAPAFSPQAFRYNTQVWTLCSCTCWGPSGERTGREKSKRCSYLLGPQPFWLERRAPLLRMLGACGPGCCYCCCHFCCPHLGIAWQNERTTPKKFFILSWH